MNERVGRREGGRDRMNERVGRRKGERERDKGVR